MRRLMVSCPVVSTLMPTPMPAVMPTVPLMSVCNQAGTHGNAQVGRAQNA